MYLRVPERGEHPERRSSHAVLAYRPCAHYQPTRQFVQVGKSIAILRQHPFRCLFLMLRPSGVPSTRDRGRMRAYTPSNTTAVVNTVDGWYARAHGRLHAAAQAKRPLFARFYGVRSKSKKRKPHIAAAAVCSREAALRTMTLCHVEVWHQILILGTGARLVGIHSVVERSRRT